MTWWRSLTTFCALFKVTVAVPGSAVFIHPMRTVAIK
jgi:hypothetical protein